MSEKSGLTVVMNLRFPGSTYFLQSRPRYHSLTPASQWRVWPSAAAEIMSRRTGGQITDSIGDTVRTRRSTAISKAVIFPRDGFQWMNYRVKHDGIGTVNPQP
ncbi:hypothetical protein M404DRAFT_1001278 [Pisolithus tinctorius Marx 270]|uniref:Uncharacterized protein n=1 Tax=Pisolithus tinctorius Marx 270 TaxID=870435 RepID=A0A0C3J2U0_PISTI|nr:hypothetical protein M404DRAFT_1001278 [Pisolithus tinctorius Marx 270]